MGHYDHHLHWVHLCCWHSSNQLRQCRGVCLCKDCLRRHHLSDLEHVHRICGTNVHLPDRVLHHKHCVAARRTGSSVAVALKMYHSLLSQTAATAAVTAVGTTLTAINANIAAINTAAGTGFSTAELTATGMTAATWTHSSASVVVPSMMALFSALLLVLLQ